MRPRYLVALRMFVGAIAGMFFGDMVGAVSHNPSFGFLVLPMMLLWAMLFLTFGHGVDRRKRLAAQPAEPVEVEEPVDACEHPDAEAVPVEVDVTGDGEPEVIGWLCIECGAKVSPGGAVRRNMPDGGPAASGLPTDVNTLRQALNERRREALDLVEGFEMDAAGGSFIISAEQHRRYCAVVEEAQTIRAALVAVEAKARNHTTVGTTNGAILSGHITAGEVRMTPEVLEVRAYGSEHPTRIIASGDFNAEPDVTNT